MTQSNVVTSYILNKYILKVFLHDIKLSFWRRTYSENSTTSGAREKVENCKNSPNEIKDRRTEL